MSIRTPLRARVEGAPVARANHATGYGEAGKKKNLSTPIKYESAVSPVPASRQKLRPESRPSSQFFHLFPDLDMYFFCAWRVV